MRATAAQVRVERPHDLLAARRGRPLAEDGEGGHDAREAVAALAGIDRDHRVDDAGCPSVARPAPRASSPRDPRRRRRKPRTTPTRRRRSAPDTHRTARRRSRTWRSAHPSSSRSAHSNAARGWVVTSRSMPLIRSVVMAKGSGVPQMGAEERPDPLPPLLGGVEPIVRPVDGEEGMTCVRIRVELVALLVGVQGGGQRGDVVGRGRRVLLAEQPEQRAPEVRRELDRRPPAVAVDRGVDVERCRRR